MTTRRLAAILAADVAGFSALMERDEEGTFARVKALRHEVIEPALARHQGRLVKTTGDGFLAEFASPVEAVRCALAVQGEIARWQEGSGEPIRLRIGVNLGDVIVDEDGDVFGEGVNVAARLEQMAEPGGVLVSGKIHDEVAGKVGAALENRGEHQVKNIACPVRVYAANGAAGTTTAAPRAAEPKLFPLPDKPSIAVLPFTNMSGDPADEFFADGIAEDIITALSHFRSLFVIARNSSFTYKGRAVNIKEVGRDLGVRYVLEGSVRRGGNRLRVTGQLIEAATGRHVWADKFEGSAEQLFEFQDQLTERVVGAIQPSLWEAEGERLRPHPTESLTAYELYLRALPLINRMTKESCGEAKAILTKATEADPQFGLAYAAAGQCHVARVLQGWSDDPALDQKQAIQLTRTALSFDSNDAEVLWRVAGVQAMAGGELTHCLAMFQRALELNPNSAHAWQWYGFAQVYSGLYADAAHSFERARRLSPRDIRAFVTTAGLAVCELFQGRFETAAKLAREAVVQNPRFTSCWRYLAASLAQAGRQAEAEEATAQLRVLDPKSSIRSVTGGMLKTPRINLYLDGLRKAGLPE